ncbi:unnamed protein product [Clavelina lepadiformis]|uniref:C3H1-type domain-containing protein n=1 Tax=Clavelina lepadiformis TaxID=159417 RepID=A0ABP0F6L7_CLALP
MDQHRNTWTLFGSKSFEMTALILPTSRDQDFSSPFDDDRVPAQTTFFSPVEAGIEPKPSIFEYGAQKSGLYPKYHDEGLCELGPDCPLVHEEKTKYFSSLDPNAPEFFPRSARKSFTASASFERSGNNAEVDILGRRLPCAAIQHRYLDSGERSEMSKTRRPCAFLQATGRCRYRSKCIFVHDEKEKRPDISAVYRYKTKICERWSRGIAHSAASCTFAHGSSELRSNYDLPPFL